MFAERAREIRCLVAFCALVGGQDELVFDGHSFVVDHTGATIARAAQFEEDLLVCDLDLWPPVAGRAALPDQPPPRARLAAPRRRQRTRSACAAADARRGRDLRGACARAARLRREERLRQRRARPLRRDRLRARRLPRRRRARRRARERRDHALPLLLRRHPGRRARAGRRARRAHARAADRAGRWTPTRSTLHADFARAASRT